MLGKRPEGRLCTTVTDATDYNFTRDTARAGRRLHCVLDGDGDIDIARVAAIHDAGPGDLTFLANRKYEKALATRRRR
jgi:hypothetical protein